MSDRDRILAEINKLGEKLGRAPSQTELRRECRITWHYVQKHFGGIKAAVRAAGLEPGPKGGPLDERTLVLDWARVVRELRRLPIQAEYDERGKYTAGTLHARIRWRELGHRFVLLVRELHLESEWADVLDIVWNQYPWLKHLAASNWEKMRPFENRVIGRSGDPTPARANPARSGGPGDLVIGKTEERGREISALGAQPRVPQPQQVKSGPVGGPWAATQERNQGMRLGRVVAAALAIEILMAAEKNLEPQRTQRNTELEIGTEAAANFSRGDCEAREEAALVIEGEAQAERAVERRGQAGMGALYGEPLGLAAMAHAPVNEDGVLFLFGVVAADLGFRIERVQRGFPDVEAKREVAPGMWELQLWELEWLSRNFKEHKHDPKGCRGIICWKHNWPDVPEGLEVIELSKVVKGR